MSKLDPDLKAKLTEAVKSFLARDGVQVSLEVDTFQTYPDFYAFLRKRMINLRKWEPLEAALARERIDQILGDAISKSQRAEALDPRQLPLFPGFEHLPRRIRAGRSSLLFERATVAQFLSFKERYEKRSERDQQIVQEMRRLATALERFAVENPELSVAAALQRAATIRPARVGAA
jgi:hypothetical protein